MQHFEYAFEHPDELKAAFQKVGYVLDDDLSVPIFLQLKLEKPILLEGPPGVGKTAIAQSLAQVLQTKLIRLQCHEGLDINSASYEWNYQKQLLHIKLLQDRDNELEKDIFGMEYLMERPLLQAIRQEQAPVLLIDEVDRSDEEFEALLLELLSDFQMSIPEVGTVKAKHKPLVVLTSNRTRELSDALKRRCLYHWIDYPDRDKEMKIVKQTIPNLEQDLLLQVINFIHQLRRMELSKTPGVAETLDWMQSLVALGCRDLDKELVAKTIGALLKTTEDIDKARVESIELLIKITKT